jgi:hypothetical protein
VTIISIGFISEWLISAASVLMCVERSLQVIGTPLRFLVPTQKRSIKKCATLICLKGARDDATSVIAQALTSPSRIGVVQTYRATVVGAEWTAVAWRTRGLRI